MSKNGNCFAMGEYVVYPAHGVGKIMDIRKNYVSGLELELLVVHFDKNKMTLSIPLSNASKTGLRKISNKNTMNDVISTLKSKAKVKRTMWSRRQQEYTAKINSGDPVSIAEVVRDLHKVSDAGEQSFGERQIFEQAFDRLSCEYAAVEKIEYSEASTRLQNFLVNE
ncbi:MAG: RNA polymerase-binding transcription factor CarD [Alphaproteobacteria bacterium ADurb.Bin438]|nr:MAG: RNA polymerase-binding transcription factor CarD [Alphaproteobacteria bacterium ADurb.Bin438]